MSGNDAVPSTKELNNELTALPNAIITGLCKRANNGDGY